MKRSGALTLRKNATYYVPRFARFSQTGSTFPSWHWPAFFVAFWWALYRNAWGAAILFFFLPFLLAIPFGILFAVLGKDHDGTLNVATILFYALTYVLPATLANGVYFRLAQKRIAEARALSPNALAQIAYLGSRGKSSVFVVVLALFVTIFVVGIIAAIAIPAYEDYVTRAKINEALSTGAAAEKFVGTYWQNNGRLPATSDVAALVDSAPHPYVERVDLDPTNGALTLTVSPAISSLAGKSLRLLPTEDANGQVTWQCVPVEIPAKYLPASCRAGGTSPAS